MSGSVQKPLVSIVMPVGNAEPYLDEALRTVTGQDYENLEILCVDDGSADGSRKILKAWAHRDPRVRVIRQAHGGAGAARNTGMAAAKGKYLLFLDADDRFHRSMVRKLVRIAEKKDTEVIVFGYSRFSGRRRIRTDLSAGDLKIPFGKVFPARAAADRLFQADHGMPWNKFYRTDFVRRTGVLFQELQNTNDEFFSRITTAEAERMLFLRDRFVDYRVGNQKSLQGGREQFGLEFAKALAAIHDELQRRGLYKCFYETYQRFAVIIILLRLEGCRDRNVFRDMVRTISTDTLQHCEVDGGYVEERYRDAYRALQAGDAPGVASGLKRAGGMRRPTVLQRIRRRAARIGRLWKWTEG